MKHLRGLTLLVAGILALSAGSAPPAHAGDGGSGGGSGTFLWVPFIELINSTTNLPSLPFYDGFHISSAPCTASLVQDGVALVTCTGGPLANQTSVTFPALVDASPPVSLACPIPAGTTMFSAGLCAQTCNGQPANQTYIDALFGKVCGIFQAVAKGYADQSRNFQDVCNKLGSLANDISAQKQQQQLSSAAVADLLSGPSAGSGPNPSPWGGQALWLSFEQTIHGCK